MDFKHFKKSHEAEDHTVLKHPDGHEIKILHSKLKKNEMGQLKSLPMMADGGDVEEADEAPAVEAPPVPATQPQQQMPPMADIAKPLQQAIGQQEQGIRAEAAAQGQLGQEQAGAMQSSYGALTRQRAATDDASQKILQEREAALDDYQKGHIDPDAYWKGDPEHNVAGHSKIMAAIGMLLGGAPVMNWVNKQIDNNVAAQQANMNKQYNTMSALTQQLGDTKSAADMHRILQSDALELLIKQQAAQSASPMAQARAQQAIGQLRQQTVPMLAQLQYRQGIMQGMQQGQLPPEAGVSVLAEPSQQPKIYESLGKVRQLNTLQSDVEQSANALNQKLLHGTLSPNETEAQVMTFAGPLQKIFEGRYNKEGAEQQMRNLMPAKTDGPGTAATKAKLRQQFFEAGRQEHYPILTGNHIPIPKPAAQATPRSFRASSNK